MDMPAYEVVDHYRLVNEHVIEQSRYNGELTIFEEAPEVVRKLAPGERAFISGRERLYPFIVDDGLWVNGTFIRGWSKVLIDPASHVGDSLYRCFQPVDPVDVTSSERVDSKWIVRLTDAGNHTGATALYLVIVK
jgi:hypothetical protein